jgi:hypothetical protein
MRLVSIQEDFIHIAPAPVFAGLERFYDRVFRLLKMLGGMPVLGRIATADMAADKTFPQMDPGISRFEALLAALATGFHLLDFSQVRTTRLWHLRPPRRGGRIFLDTILKRSRLQIASK